MQRQVGKSMWIMLLIEEEYMNHAIFVLYMIIFCCYNHMHFTLSVRHDKRVGFVVVILLDMSGVCGGYFVRHD